jgi:LysR family glycine cleavage system transcriptional activator
MRIPSMNALRALDGLARHGSMIKASQELNLTPSAISHQIRFLEGEVGQKLLVRDGKGVALTMFGRRYANEIQKALAIIGHAGTFAGDEEPIGTLRISCVPGFAIFWLCNHLAEFRALYPKIELEISSPHRLDDVWDPQVEIFIAYGRGNFPGMTSEVLTRIEFTPYCSPALLEGREALSVEDVARLPLLHMGSHEDWSRWLSAEGSAIDPRRGIVFSNMFLVLSAAVAGLGLAMGDDLTCRAAVEQGQLVKPFISSVPSLEAYHLVAEPSMLERPTCMAFANWLRSKLPGGDGSHP